MRAPVSIQDSYVCKQNPFTNIPKTNGNIHNIIAISHVAGWWLCLFVLLAHLKFDFILSTFNLFVKMCNALRILNSYSHFNKINTSFFFNFICMDGGKPRDLSFLSSHRYNFKPFFVCYFFFCSQVFKIHWNMEWNKCNNHIYLLIDKFD